MQDRAHWPLKGPSPGRAVLTLAAVSPGAPPCQALCPAHAALAILGVWGRLACRHCQPIVQRWRQEAAPLGGEVPCLLHTRSSFSPTPAGWRSTRVGGVHPSNLTQLPLLGMQALSSHVPPRPGLVTGLRGSIGNSSRPSSSIGCNGHCEDHGGAQVRCLGWYPSCHTALM